MEYKTQFAKSLSNIFVNELTQKSNFRFNRNTETR